jgi:hypothetical protein
MRVVDGSSATSLWPSVEELVPPELPPDIAVARLVALTRSLLVENRELRDALAATRRQDGGATRTRDGGAEAA